MKSHIKIIFCLFLFLLLSWNVKAEEFLFRQLSISEGFPPSIQYIYAEDNGYVWIVSK